jgi:uncharacterized coiled-coil DUF342 family protein
MPKVNGQVAKTSALTGAAAALEDELRRYASLSSNAVKMPLTTEKGIDRAAKAIAEAAESQQRIAEHVKSLIEAINEARETQQTSATTLNERADVIAQRREELAALLARFGKLGEVGQALNAGLQKVAAYKPDPYGASAETKEVRDALDAIANGLSTCAEHAAQLATEAQGLEFEDLARQADGLRQQILATKNRLSLVQKAFAG